MCGAKKLEKCGPVVYDHLNQVYGQAMEPGIPIKGVSGFFSFGPNQKGENDVINNRVYKKRA
jgi:hypothetical protein